MNVVPDIPPRPRPISPRSIPAMPIPSRPTLVFSAAGSDLQASPKHFSTGQLLELPAVDFDLRAKIALILPRSDHNCIFEMCYRSKVLDACRRCGTLK